MFETSRVARPAILPGLLASLIVHASAVWVFWEARALPVRFSGIEVVYAAPEREPLWLPSPVDATPAGTTENTPSPFSNAGSVPSQVQTAPVEDSQPSEGEPAPLKAGFITDSSGPEPVAGRLQEIPRLAESGHLEVDAPPPEVIQPKVEMEPRRELVIQQARLIKKTIPIYPELARTARVEGAVILQADISETGTLENITVTEGHPMLIQAAIDAVRKWRYEPARLNGVPTRSSVAVTVRFHLEFQ